MKSWLMGLTLAAAMGSAQAQVLYTNGFDKAEVEKVPEDMKTAVASAKPANQDIIRIKKFVCDGALVRPHSHSLPPEQGTQ